MRPAQHAAGHRGGDAPTATLPGYGHPYPQPLVPPQAVSGRPGARDVALAQETAWMATEAREKAAKRFYAALTILIVLLAIPLAAAEAYWLIHHVAGR